MDTVERLSLEAASAETLIACEHRQRYELARELCAGLRVLDLCCGTGYGTQLIAERAAAAVGVDNDAASVDVAQAHIAPAIAAANIGFEAADAVAYLDRPLRERFDALVCFEGLEHLPELDRVLGRLRLHAAGGMKLIVSVPNSRLFEEENAYHLTDFGYGEAMAAFDGFPDVEMLPQYLAEGSVICPAGARGTEFTLATQDRREPEYANHFIFCVGVDHDALNAAHRGRMLLEAAPVHNRYMRGLERANSELWRTNARLARQHLGREAGAAASYMFKLEQRALHAEEQLEQARERRETAERDRNEWCDRALRAEKRERALHAEGS